ncbi:MAG: hypothetical protein H6R14_1676 [Proteobacteria bacterium]|nr:hypothetical protein [Pseudomonadota bacterium]
MQKSLHLLCVTCITTLLVSCGSGKGIDARLDATKGYDANFNASVIKALESASPQQREIFLGLVEGLPLEHFLARYGKEPTVKEVANGQLERYIAQLQEEIAHLESRINSPASELQSIVQKISEANRKMESISGEVTEIKQKDWDSSHCNSSGCVKKYAINVKINAPAGITFSKLPCTIEIKPQGATAPFTIVENCGGRPGGDYTFEIADKEAISFVNATSKIEFIRSEARQKNGDSEEYVIPRRPKEIEELDQGKSRLATAQASKKLFN